MAFKASKAPKRPKTFGKLIVVRAHTRETAKGKVLVKAHFGHAKAKKR